MLVPAYGVEIDIDIFIRMEVRRTLSEPRKLRYVLP